MGCNCKTNQQIFKITKKYGHRVNVPWGEKIKFRTEESFKTILLYLMLLIFFPIMIGFFIFLIRKSKNGVLKQQDFLKYFLKKK